MISSDGCRRLVAGSYDVLINEPISCKLVLKDFLEHFRRHEDELGQPNCGYVREFKMLKEFSKTLKENKANIEDGEMDCNQRKNRYKDIIPFSHTRVILSGNPEPGSDYINANYIRGPSGSSKAYIACQGPLPNTLHDFWRMIWECDVSVIIMACNEFESGKPKCELYWPDELETSQTYGNIQVTLMRVRQINSDFLIRKFSIKLLEPIISNAKQDTDETQQHHQKPKQQEHHNQLSHNHYQQQVINNNNNFIYNNSIDLNKHSNNDDFKSSVNNIKSQNDCNSCLNNQLIINSCKSNNNYHNNGLDGNSAGNSSTSDESINTDSDSPQINNQQQQHIENHQSDEGPIIAANTIPICRKRAVLMERTICQFHYTTWPDHGAPPSVHPILELVRLVREVQPAEDRPILVHCSAGCGRTGTICCIDYVWGLLRRGKLEPSLDLYSIISEMREQRMAMVQTLEQYILCHRAVAALFMQQLQLMGEEDDEEEGKNFQTNVDEEEDADLYDDDLGPVLI